MAATTFKVFMINILLVKYRAAYVINVNKKIKFYSK